MSDKKKMDFTKIKLEYKYRQGCGRLIFATLGQEFNCVEFVKLKEYAQPILEPNRNQLENKKLLIGMEQWIHFPPKEWNEALDAIYTEMVRLWNEKYNEDIKDETENKLENIIKQWIKKADDKEHAPNKESKKAYLDCANTLKTFIQFLKYGYPKFE